jgi:AraC family transcriptional regulator
MFSLTPILRAIDFIEYHLREDVRIADVAEAALYSVFHFCRMFNATAHHSPYDYLMRRRLSEAGRELVETDQKIIDVALNFHFNSPKTFSRAFRRMFDRSPRQWRVEGRLDRRQLMSRLTADHLAHRNAPEFVRPGVEEQEQLQVAGLMTQVDDEFAAVPPLWETLRGEIGEAVGAASYFGIICYPEGAMTLNLFYMAAVEVDTPHDLGSALAVKTIPTGRYARMSHAGGFDDLHLALDYVYNTWLPRIGMQSSFPLAVECYGSDIRHDGQRTLLVPIK